MNQDQKKKRFDMWIDPAALARLDEWRRRQPDLPPRAEAIRRLIEIGIDASEAESKRRSTKRRKT